MTQSIAYKGSLAGLKIIDFGHYYAGPMVAMLLADQGANVIHIAKPGEPESSTHNKELPEQQFRVLNRNKKCLTLDLKSEEGKAQALSLIEKADVVIENFRPGVMRRLGLDYTSVKESNPGLVYLSLPGFASTDKARSGIQAWDGVIAAAACMYDTDGCMAGILGFPPQYTWVPLTSTFGAMQGAIAVMAALNAREAHGYGTVIEVPLVDAGLSLFGDNFIFQKTFYGPLRKPGDEASGNALPGYLKLYEFSPDDSQAEREAKLKKVMEGIFFTTSDGKKILMTITKPAYAERLYRIMGIYKQLRQEGFTNDGQWDDCGLDTNLTGGLSAERAARKHQLVSEVIQTKTAEEWEPLLEKAGVPFAVLRTRDEWLALESNLRSGVLTLMDDGQSKLTVPGRVADMSGPGGVLRDTTPCEPENISVQQAQALLQQTVPRQVLGKRPTQGKGELLRGLKVLDLCNIVAGPESSYNLAQYGAEIIKAEPPNSNDYPNNMRVGLEVYQGKRSILSDATTALGREVFNKLVVWADVVVHNVLDDTAKRLGVTQTQLQAVNPDVICCQLSCFGGTWRGRGGWELRRGHDGEVQAPTGTMVHYGSIDNPQFHGGLSNDVMTGLALSFSALLGLYQKHRSGYAGEGRASLARSACYNQLPCMIAENGSSDWGEPRGQFAVGPYWWQRLYQCQDGWIFVGASEEHKTRLLKTITQGENYTPDTAPEETLQLAFQKQKCADWQSKLNAIGIGCHQAMNPNTLIANQGVRSVDNGSAREIATCSAEILIRKDHPCGEAVIFLAPNWVRVGENHTYMRLSAAPRRGAHTREVLQELGYNEAEIDELIRLNVCHDFIPAIGNEKDYFFTP